MKSKTYGKYHNINFSLEANSFAPTNCTGQLCLISDKTIQSHNNTIIVIKQSMNLVRLNSSNKIETRKCLFEIYPNIFIFDIRAVDVINISFLFRVPMLSGAILITNTTRIALFTPCFDMTILSVCLVTGI